MHISELHHKMTVAQGQGQEGGDIQLRMKAYTASVREKDVRNLLRDGRTDNDISEVLGVSMIYVDSQRTRIEKDDEERRRFMMTLRMPQQYIPGMPTVYTIYQR